MIAAKLIINNPPRNTKKVSIFLLLTRDREFTLDTEFFTRFNLTNARKRKKRKKLTEESSASGNASETAARFSPLMIQSRRKENREKREADAQKGEIYFRVYVAFFKKKTNFKNKNFKKRWRKKDTLFRCLFKNSGKPTHPKKLLLFQKKKKTISI